MKTKHILLPAIALLLLTGCNEKEKFSRYPYVPMPCGEFESLITDVEEADDEELVYNAICNLAPLAQSFGKDLSKKEADPESEDFIMASNSFHAVTSRLTSDNPLTLAAALRFLQLFAEDYKNKEELLELAKTVNSKNALVLFEQCELFKRTGDEDTSLPEPLLRRFLDHSSWVVSRSSYDLIGLLKDEPLRSELVQRYVDAQNDRDRMLLLQALGHQLTPTEARLVEQDILQKSSNGVWHVAAKVLMDNADCSGVTEWFEGYFPAQNTGDQQVLFGNCGNTDLKCRFIEWGYAPDNEYMERILKEIHNHKRKADQKKSIKIGHSLRQAPQTTEYWGTIEAAAKLKQEQLDAIHPDVLPIAEAFAKEVEALLAKHNIPKADRDLVQKQVNTALQPLWNTEEHP